MDNNESKRLVTSLAKSVGVEAACDSFDIPRSTYYYWVNPEKPIKHKKRRTPNFAYSKTEKQQVLALMNSEKYADKTPYEIFYSELDKGNYFCSIRTMYRILNENKQIKERRKIKLKTNYKKPELLASKPNEVWSWDITKLKGPAKWTYFYLYVIVDIFSRFVVGWMLEYREKSSYAVELIAETCRRQNIHPGELTIHADRGASMKSKPVAFLMSDLGICKTHSRPHVSNDNPYSEAHFKTMKYRPSFPKRFKSMNEAKAFCRDFFHWYNEEHYHSGISFYTPKDVHYNLVEKVLDKRVKTMEKAFKENPKRFKNKIPILKSNPSNAWINKPKNGGEKNV